jgi:hypothetical protein
VDRAMEVAICDHPDSQAIVASETTRMTDHLVAQDLSTRKPAFHTKFGHLQSPMWRTRSNVHIGPTFPRCVLEPK